MGLSSECSCRVSGIAPGNSAKVKERIEELLGEGAEQTYLHSDLPGRKKILFRFGVLVNEGLCERIALLFPSKYPVAEAAVIAVHDGKVEYWSRQFDTDIPGHLSHDGKELVVFEDVRSGSPEEQTDRILASFDTPERDYRGWMRL